MSEHEELQKLLRLKKYETPGEDYFENFVTEFRERQTSESLQSPSSFFALKQRTTEWFDDLGTAKWAVPAGSFATALLAFFALQSTSREKQISDTKPPVETSKEGTPAKPVFELQIQTSQDGAAAEIQKNSVLPTGFQGSTPAATAN